MKKRFLFLTLGATLVTALALNALNVSMNLSANNVDRSIMLANVEALAAGESGDHWISGYRTGTTTINGQTIPCCLKSEYQTDACNYGVINCMRIK
jgi:hypothetical protein